MALCVGFFFGTQFLGVEYMRLCTDELHTCNGNMVAGARNSRQCDVALQSFVSNNISYVLSIIELDYVFGHYTGILLSSTLWFVIYCLIQRNSPQVYPKIIVPGLISGIMWGIAMGT